MTSPNPASCSPVGFLVPVALTHLHQPRLPFTSMLLHRTVSLPPNMGAKGTELHQTTLYPALAGGRQFPSPLLEYLQPHVRRPEVSPPSSLHPLASGCIQRLAPSFSEPDSYSFINLNPSAVPMVTKFCLQAQGQKLNHYLLSGLREQLALALTPLC